MTHFLLLNFEDPAVEALVEGFWKEPRTCRWENITGYFSGAASHSFYSFDGQTGFLQGYVRDLGLPAEASLEEHHRQFFGALHQWPLPDRFTGSFGAVSIHPGHREIILGNDPVGFYPVYYYRKGERFAVSSSLILLGALAGNDIDPAGVVQRLTGPGYLNYGSRTMIRNCSRLLPGEWIRFGFDGVIQTKAYDNSLFQSLGSADQKQIRRIAPAYWKEVKKEFDYLLRYFPQVHFSLSGGMDSRLALGAIDGSVPLHCYTYGGDDFYETRIARRLAGLRGAPFRSFKEYDLFFPDFETIRQHIAETESLGVVSYLSVLKDIGDGFADEPILFGDMSESLPAKSILSLNSRKTRIRSFLTKFILRKDIAFTPAGEKAISRWEERITRRILDRMERQYLEYLSLSVAEFEETLRADLRQLFDRIRQHNLPYVELHEELFMWYTNARMAMGKKMLSCSAKFLPICPMMSRHVLQQTSRIHPNLRLYYRTFNHLFRTMPELIPFGRIPTAQVPFIPYNAPEVIKFLWWGVRSRIDNFLIRKSLKDKSRNHYRLLQSRNWMEIYQHPEGEERIRSWFQKAAFFPEDELIAAFNRRKNLESWPLTNVDIISQGTVNVKLTIIKELINRYLSVEKLKA